MANSDYKEVSTGVLCPVAELAVAVTDKASDTVFQLKNLSLTSSTDPREVGDPILIDDEVCVITAIGTNTITVGRGCWDTIPAKHSVNAVVWFPQFPIAYDPLARLGSQSVGVKLCTHTATGLSVPVEGAPPVGVTIGMRFIRPYPPGNLRVDGAQFGDAPFLVGPNQPRKITLSWAHRDRVLQADTLISHTNGSIGPEAGTTYTVQILNSSSQVRRTISGLTGTSVDYTLAMARSDFAGQFTGTHASGFVTVESTRGGYTSLQRYKFEITVEMMTLVTGNLATASTVTRPVLSPSALAPRNTAFSSTLTRPTVTLAP